MWRPRPIHTWCFTPKDKQVVWSIELPHQVREALALRPTPSTATRKGSLSLLTCNLHSAIFHKLQISSGPPYEDLPNAHEVQQWYVPSEIQSGTVSKDRFLKQLWMWYPCSDPVRQFRVADTKHPPANLWYFQGAALLFFWSVTLIILAHRKSSRLICLISSNDISWCLLQSSQNGKQRLNLAPSRSVCTAAVDDNNVVSMHRPWSACNINPSYLPPVPSASSAVLKQILCPLAFRRDAGPSQKRRALTASLSLSILLSPLSQHYSSRCAFVVCMNPELLYTRSLDTIIQLCFHTLDLPKWDLKPKENNGKHSQIFSRNALLKRPLWASIVQRSPAASHEAECWEVKHGRAKTA